MKENKGFLYEVIPTSRFKKDLVRVQKRGYDLALLENIVDKLAMGESLPPKNRNHPLKGNYIGFWECHITPDWLLVYIISEQKLILTLARTGTHSDLL